jgi:glycosyltransferase Alg8
MGMNAQNHSNKTIPKGFLSFGLYTACLFIAIGLLPATSIDPAAKVFIAGIGLLALWRYSWGLIHFLRSIYYRSVAFPKLRKKADMAGEDALPSKIYILMTIFRIDPAISSRAIRGALEEAIRSKIPTTIIASIVEEQDEYLFKTIFDNYDVPDYVDLRISRLPGKGKRVGLAHGFRAISRDIPDDDAVVVVMDGDTILTENCLRQSTPFFKTVPNLGALTTDELCELENASPAMREWHDMRFAQRQLLMSSISLSKRVMTLTGRMSMFRADIVTSPEFIEHMTTDSIRHWRLGHFNFLTGDDKSSLYHVIKKGYAQLYLPDVKVVTVEDPPHPNFIKASSQLMFRWFGNMLRTNGRIIGLGPTRMPFFVWWSFLDQRISIWTTLAGPVFAVMLSIQFGAIILLYYLIWVAFIRWVMSLMLLSARRQISWRYPFLLYYGQVYGALMKSWVMFRLDIQSWTRQKTKSDKNMSKSNVIWNRWTSHVMHATAIIVFICLIGLATGTLELPEIPLDNFEIVAESLRSIHNG